MTPSKKLAKYVLECTLNGNEAETENKALFTQRLIQDLHKYWLSEILPFPCELMEVRELEHPFAQVEVYWEETKIKGFYRTQGDLLRLMKKHNVSSVRSKVKDISYFEPETSRDIARSAVVVVTHICAKWNTQQMLVLSFDGPIMKNHKPILQVTNEEDENFANIRKLFEQNISNEWHLPRDFVRMAIGAQYIDRDMVCVIADMYFSHPVYKSTEFGAHVREFFEVSGNGFAESAAMESRAEQCLVFEEPIEIVELHLEGPLTVNESVIDNSPVPAKHTKEYENLRQLIIDSIVSSLNYSNYPPECVLKIEVHKVDRGSHDMYAYASIVFDGINITRIIGEVDSMEDLSIEYLEFVYPQHAAYKFSTRETHVINTTTLCSDEHSRFSFNDTWLVDIEDNTTKVEVKLIVNDTWLVDIEDNTTKVEVKLIDLPSDSSATKARVAYAMSVLVIFPLVVTKLHS